MGAHLLRHRDPARSHRVRLVQSGRYERAEKAVCEAARNQLLEEPECPDERQADAAQVRQDRQPEPAVCGERSDTIAAEGQSAGPAQERQVGQPTEPEADRPNSARPHRGQRTRNQRHAFGDVAAAWPEHTQPDHHHQYDHSAADRDHKDADRPDEQTPYRRSGNRLVPTKGTDSDGAAGEGGHQQDASGLSAVSQDPATLPGLRRGARRESTARHQG